jgi:hypothetical protein
MQYRITRESCRAAGACWSDARLAAIIPEGGFSPAEVAALEKVTLADRVWALIRASGISHHDRASFAIRTARRAVGQIAPPGPRSAHALDVAERYLAGDATREELRAATRAAATRAAAYAYAAYAAARAAAATRAAAYAAAAAAYYAADAAASASRDAERRAQLADLLGVLGRPDVSYRLNNNKPEEVLKNK